MSRTIPHLIQSRIHACSRPQDTRNAVVLSGEEISTSIREKASPHSITFHLWSLVPGERESISLIYPVMAGRFLEEGGLFCAVGGEPRGAAVLRNWEIRYPERVLISGVVLLVVSVDRIAPITDAATIFPHDGAGH